MRRTACGGSRLLLMSHGKPWFWLPATNRAAGEARFYRNLIATADQRFDDHLARQKKGH